jgi:hypothetical protein
LISPAVVAFIGIGAVFAVAAGWLFVQAHRIIRDEERWVAETVAAEPQTVTLTIFADTSRFVAAMRDMARMMAAVTETTATAADRFRQVGVTLAAGLEQQRRLRHARALARWQVRAGLDPRYRDPAALHKIVKRLAAGKTPDTRHLSEAERLEVAVAAIRGWSDAYTTRGPRKPVAEIRHYGNTTVTLVAP